MQHPNQRNPFAVVVNDNASQLKHLSGLLRRAGLETLEFTQAEAALAAMTARSKSGDRAANVLPAIIVTDLYMPGLDGWRFCRLLRSPEYAAFNHVPILVVSDTFSGDEVSRITADLGAEAFLPYPVDDQRFGEQVRAMLSGERLRTPPRVLIVDDNGSLCDLLKAVFVAHGYQADIALTAQAAAEAFRQNAYDAAVLDYHLPDRTGDTLLDEFHAARPGCVCLMMTSDPGPELALDWLERGAAAYVRKPFEAGQIIELCAKARRERALLRAQDLLEARTRELLESEQEFRALAEAMPQIVWATRPDGWNIYFNQQWVDYTGLTLEESYGHGWNTPFHPDDRQRAWDAWQRATQKNDTYELECRLRRADGAYRWWLIRGTPFRNASGEILKWFGTCTNIEAIKQAEASLRQSEVELKGILDTNADGILAVDNQGKIIRVNRRFASLWRIPSSLMDAGDDQQLLNFVLNQLSEPEAFLRKVRALYSSTEEDTDTLIFKDGRIFERHSTPLIKEGALVGRVWCFRDITDRKRAEEETRRAQEWFGAIFNASRDGIIAEENEIIIQCNPAFAHFYGYAEPGELIGKHVSVIQATEDNERMLRFGQMRLRNEPVPEVYEFRGLRKDGAQVAAEASVSKVEIAGRNYIVSVVRDITERKRAEADKAKLEVLNRQLQKSESLGRMAGAIAHHFNNQLQTVMMNLEMAMNDLPQTSAPFENLAEAMQSARKASEVSSLMLAYLGQTHGKREPLDLSEVCQRHLPILRASMPQRVALETDLPPAGPTISGDANQLRQILTNLVTNAWESMGNGGGSIRLAVKTASLSDMPAARRFPIDWRPDAPAYACLEVADTGCGIVEQNIEKIFDPFFSTKFTGRGMGLAVVLGIARSHGGVITVASEPGRWSVFRVFFPVPAAAVPKAPDKTQQVPGFKGGGAMLLVEDEPSLRKVVTVALTRLGFTVLAAKDGIEAVELFRRHPSEIRFVLSDLTMPRMNGWEILTALRQIAPGIPVILASGYNEAQVMEGNHPELPQAFLSKPYVHEELVDAISRILR